MQQNVEPRKRIAHNQIDEKCQNIRQSLFFTNQNFFKQKIEQKRCHLSGKGEEISMQNNNNNNNQ